MNRCLLLIFSAALFNAPFAMAQESRKLVLSSGSLETPLIELYTSEGCSSCPPADRWLQSLAGARELWTRFVPVAFHVTYWNYLGWSDRFAHSSYDQRQRQVALLADTGVYTPGVFLQGREWRHWRRSPDAHQQLQRPLAGTLQAHVGCKSVDITYMQPLQVTTEPAQLALAWMHPPQQSQVTRGENRGRELQHAFVVARHMRQPLSPQRNPQGAQESAKLWKASVNAACRWPDVQPWAVAVWVSDADGRPLQAVGGELPAGWIVGD